jgi:hypothetical protein
MPDKGCARVALGGELAHQRQEHLQAAAAALSRSAPHCSARRRRDTQVRASTLVLAPAQARKRALALASQLAQDLKDALASAPVRALAQQPARRQALAVAQAWK